MKKILYIFLIVSSYCLSFTISDGKYIEIKDGHFYYNGERIRFWGINIMYHHVKNYKGAEITAKRLKDMGFNCVFIWITKGAFHSPEKKWIEFVDVKKGSETGLDLIDYFVYCLKKEGIFVAFNLSIRGDTLKEDVFDLVKRNDISKEKWWELIQKGYTRYLKFVDPSIKQAYIEKMKFFLNRKNPYTGKKYSEEECIAFYQLEDEMGFLAWPPGRIDDKDNLFSILLKKKWEEFLKERYKTNEEMWKVWGERIQDETIDNMKFIFYSGSGYSLTYPEGKKKEFYAGTAFKNTPEKRAEDAWQFLYSLTEEFYRDYLKELRSQAKKGIGVNVIPVAVDSVIYTKPGNFYDIAKNSDFLCGTGIGVIGGIDKIDNSYGWKFDVKVPFLSHYSVEPTLLKVNNMPYCPLAGSNNLNNPYRGVIPFLRSLWASWQDWDGVFTFWWGYFQKEIDIDYKNYDKFPLRVNYEKEKNRAYDLLNDEISCSIHKISSLIFLNFLLPPAKNPTKFYFGKKLLYSTDAGDYYHFLYPFMVKTSYKYGVEIIFDEKGDYKVKWDGKILEGEIENPLIWENGVEWNFEDDYIKIDNKYIKGYAGNVNSDIEFKDRIKIKNINRDFVVFLLVSGDKKEIKDSKLLYYSIVNTSFNNGYKEDFSKIQFFKQHIYEYPLPWSVVVDPGNLPIIVKRVECEIYLPFSGIVENYNFYIEKISEEKFENKIKISEKEPIFFGIIKKLK